MFRKSFICCFFGPALLLGQSSIDAQRASVAAQLRSVQMVQRKSVARQLNRPAVEESSFFELPSFEPAAGQAVQESACEPVSVMRLGSIVERAARRENIPASLIHAVIKQESGGSPCAVSIKGAMGLMQLMPGTASDLEVEDPMDPEQNVSGGARLLGSLMREYKGDLSRVLAAYNAGRKRVNDAGGVPDFPETLNYVSSILAKLSFIAK